MIIKSDASALDLGEFLMPGEKIVWGQACTPLAMSTEGVDLTPSVDLNFTAQTLPPSGEPQHPFMAVTDTSAMHSGSWENDTHPASITERARRLLAIAHPDYRDTLAVDLQAIEKRGF